MSTEKQLDASNENEASWLGVWKNQYGSELEIIVQKNGRVEGFFQTALEESSLYGSKCAVIGTCAGDLIGFTVAGGKDIKILVGYTGILRDGKMETLWHMVTGEKISAGREGEPAEKKKIEAWQAFVTSLDTFERVS